MQALENRIPTARWQAFHDRCRCTKQVVDGFAFSVHDNDGDRSTVHEFGDYARNERADEPRLAAAGAARDPRGK